MTPQENVATKTDRFSEEEAFFDEEYLRDWLEAVRIMLRDQIRSDMPIKRQHELDAYILLRGPAITTARELVGQLSAQLIDELSGKPVERLVETLSDRLDDYLLSRAIRAITDWLEKGMWEAAKESPGPWPTKGPEEMAWRLLEIMADSSSNAIFCPSEALPAVPSCKAHKWRYLEPQCAACKVLAGQPEFLALLGRAQAVRSRVIGIAVIMLYEKTRKGKTINKERPSGQN